MPERLMDLKPIKSNDTAALYLNIMAASSASIIYKMLMPMSEAPNIL